jgi:hypothetical protein
MPGREERPGMVFARIVHGFSPFQRRNSFKLNRYIQA